MSRHCHDSGVSVRVPSEFCDVIVVQLEDALAPLVLVGAEDTYVEID